MIPLLTFLLILTGCSPEAKAPENDHARVEVPIPPRREEIKPDLKPSYYQSLDERLDKLQGQLEWAQKRIGGN